ncbi:hypothetical protein CK203_034698 [Vitis vinifera]|uniref:Uncharacterized protein n=1 Tax=Vitis vinifera TaxID=29760 RepID=A0A438HWI4_VITVI|nr:hypothetical protein CK203_081419 [Vitis vinifera]RVW88824.1 hypothetical protein CK203_034698 [Vitis vinifera]
MAIIESLVEYIRGDFSKPKSSSRGNHAKSGGNKGLKSYIAAKEGSSKTSSGKEGMQLLKRNALNAMIDEKEKEGDAHVKLMQLLNALKIYPMPRMP